MGYSPWGQKESHTTEAPEHMGMHELKHSYKLLSSVQLSSVAQSCPTLATPWTVAHQAPLSMGFSRQVYWSGLPCPPPGNLPDPGTEPTLFCVLIWQVDSLPVMPPGKPRDVNSLVKIFIYTILLYYQEWV